ncbi:MAG: hypothetical protein AAF614_21405 [Chloroflexota bacterium]
MSIVWIVFFAVIVLGTVSVAVWDKLRPISVKCVHCQSTQVVETERRSVGKHSFRFIGGGLKPDAAGRIQQNIEVIYRCQACGKRFGHRTTKMS